MQRRKTETFVILFIAMWASLSGRLLSEAQTNHSALLRAAAAHIVVPKPVVARVSTNAAAGRAVVDVQLPKDLSRYHVVERHGQITRPTTNFSATSAQRGRASLDAGTTLMFLDKEPRKAAQSNSPSTLTPLFSTLMVKAEPPERPGMAPRTSSGTLTLQARLDPVPWNDSSNAYVGELMVMFSTDDPKSSFLPMTVALSATGLKNIDPENIILEKANVEGVKDVTVICDSYRPDVQITAHYQTTKTDCDLHLQRLGFWAMAQMIISKPMLFASLTGGLIGGLLLLFKEGFQVGRVARHLAEGATVGLVTVTMLLAGLLQTQIAGISTVNQAVLAFALAASAGSVGAHFLDKAIANLLGNSTPSPAGDNTEAHPASGPIPQ